MTSNNVYKVTQGHEKMEPVGSSLQSPERRIGGGLRVGVPGVRGSPNGGTGHKPITDRQLPTYSQSTGIEWNKPSSAELLRANIGGTSTKFQGLGLYDHKPTLFQSSPNTNLNLKIQTPSPVNEPKLPPKQRTPTGQYHNKMSDKLLFSSKDKETFNFRRSPSPLNSSPWGGPELSQPEPESQQCPPPPTSPPGHMSRQDQKRMTLGHSKLDLVNHYNKLKTKQVYSRFELKSKNWRTVCVLPHRSDSEEFSEPFLLTFYFFIIFHSRKTWNTYWVGHFGSEILFSFPPETVSPLHGNKDQLLVSTGGFKVRPRAICSHLNDCVWPPTSIQGWTLFHLVEQVFNKVFSFLFLQIHKILQKYEVQKIDSLVLTAFLLFLTFGVTRTTNIDLLLLKCKAFSPNKKIIKL